MYITKLTLLQKEANRISKSYDWPSITPQFQVVYNPKATGAYINLDTLVITLSTKHMHLPIEHVRVTLAHEIAHHYQEIISYKPTLFDALLHRKYILGSIFLGWIYAIFQVSNTMLNTSNVYSLDFYGIFITLFYTVFAIILGKELLSRAQEQLVEIDADIRAVTALKDTKHAVNYFTNNQNAQYPELLSMKNNNQNILQGMSYKFITTILNRAYSKYSSLFSTHPTDSYRIQNIIKVSNTI